MSKQDIEKRLGFAAQGVKAEMAARPGVKAEMAAPENWEAKLELKNLAGSFNIENLRELLGASKEFVSRYPQYKALGQKLVDGINMVVSAVKQMKTESMKAARPGVKATFAEFNVGDKVVYVPDSRHIDAYGRIIKIENGIAIIASAEGNVKAKLSDLELVKKGSVEDLRRLGMKGFARSGVKAKFAADKRTTAGALRKALKAKGITSADDLEWHGISPNDPDSTPYWLYEDGSMEKIKSARAGAKTRFAADKRTTAGALRKALKAKGITSAADLEWHGISAKDPDSTPYWLYEDGSMEKIKSSRSGAKTDMSKATDALAFIKSSIESGKTVYIQTPRGATKVTPKTYAKFEALGRPLFKIGTDGALLMSSGSSYVRLTMGEDEMLVRVSAMSRPGVKAKA